MTLVIIFLPLFLNPSPAVGPSAAQRRMPAPHHVLVKYKPPAEEISLQSQDQARQAVESTYGLKPLKHFPYSNVRLYETEAEAAAVISRLRGDPAVLYAEPDYRAYITATIPNDPRFGEQWGLNNTGQSAGRPTRTSTRPKPGM